MPRKKVDVGTLCEASNGMLTPRTVVEEKLGNYLLTEEHLDSSIRIHWSENHIELRALAAGEIVELEVHE